MEKTTNKHSKQKLLQMEILVPGVSMATLFRTLNRISKTSRPRQDADQHRWWKVGSGRHSHTGEQQQRGTHAVADSDFEKRLGRKHSVGSQFDLGGSNRQYLRDIRVASARSRKMARTHNGY